jgi:hypothetical protein
VCRGRLWDLTEYAFSMSEEDDFVEYMIEVGILEEDGFDEDGEVTYTYNFDLMKVLMPEMYDEIMAGITNNLVNLYELGLVNVDYDENLQAHFSASDEGKEFFKGLYD